MQRFFNFTKLNIDIILILTIAVFFRARDILTFEFWVDEAFTGILMRLPVREFLQIVRHDAHPPLFNVFLRIWSTFFGTGEFFLRLPSLIFGILTVLLSYILVKKSLGKTFGLICALLMAINPFLIGYSVEARSYSFYGFITLLTFYLLIQRKNVLFVISSALLLFTHYIALLYVIPMLVFFMYQNFNKKSLSNTFKKCAPAIFVFIVLIITTFMGLNASSDKINTDWVRKVSFNNIPRSITSYTYGVKVKLPGADEINNTNLGVNIKYIGYVIFLIYLSGIIMYLYRPKQNKNELLEFILINILFIFPQITLILVGHFTKYNLYVERYIFPSSIFFIFGAIYILNKITSFEISIILLLIYFFTTLKIQRPYYHNGIKEIAKQYRNFSNEIVFSSPVDYVVSRYYFGENFLNIKIQDPLNPSLTFYNWPRVRNNTLPTDNIGAVYISPFENIMKNDFIKVSEIGSFGIHRKKISTK